MFFFKIYYHIIAEIKKIFYKIVYGNKIKFGKRVTFRKGFSLMIDKDAEVIIKEGCFFNNYCSINAMKKVEIGKNCIFGENVKIYDHNHIFKYKDKLIKQQGLKTGDVSIEDNCWIGSNTVILKNTKIGTNSVIAAGEKINFTVDNNTIVKNNRCEKIRYE